MVWDTPLERVETPLLAKGVLLEDAGARFVLLAFDWCIIGSESERTCREGIARAAGTDPKHVAIQTLHQHDAPYADAGAHRLLERSPNPPPHLSSKFVRDLSERLMRAVQQA